MRLRDGFPGVSDTPVVVVVVLVLVLFIGLKSYN